MFDIWSISSGWIMGEMKDGQNTHFFDYSYITDFITKLTRALLYIHGELEAWGDDDCFTAHSEPATDIWKLSLEEDTLHIIIKHYKDIDSKIFDKTIKYEFNYYEFVDSFLLCMKKVLNNFGLLGYREEWCYEFPMSLFLKLVDVSNKSERIKFTPVLEELNMGQAAKRTDLKAESDVLGLYFDLR